ncbi:hypothetical protein MASR1M12_17090 [Erysipelotrichia bacterium]
MNRRMIVLVAILSIIMIASGCGSGGGSGRYTIPPEIPTPGTGTGGGGTGGTGETDIESLILSGWEDFKYGAYSSAINKFNQALISNNITDNQKYEAYNGLGWAQTKSTGAASAHGSFSQAVAGNSDAAFVGLAASLIQLGQRDGFSRALELLNKVGGKGLSDNTTTFATKYPVGVSNAEAHAMIAWCYFWTGNTTEAVRKINYARTIESAADSSVTQIFEALKKLDSDSFK